jgi:hypothetical protein
MPGVVSRETFITSIPFLINLNLCQFPKIPVPEHEKITRMLQLVSSSASYMYRQTDWVLLNTVNVNLQCQQHIQHALVHLKEHNLFRPAYEVTAPDLDQGTPQLAKMEQYYSHAPM